MGLALISSPIGDADYDIAAIREAFVGVLSFPL